MSSLTDFIEAERLSSSFLQLVRVLHRPVAARIARAARLGSACLTVGICGAQGSGKSTMAAVLKLLLEEQGLKVAALSIDDFYLAREARETLAATVHPLLRTRGVPGTHDVALGKDIFKRLMSSGPTLVPRFDKARDTRRPQAEWETIVGPVDVILFEGWCVGAKPQAPAALVAPINRLERDQDPDGTWRRFVNDALAGLYQNLFARIRMLVMLAAPGFDTVFGWRLEQEHKLKARILRERGDLARVMGDAEVETFIRHYERLTRHILREMPARADLLIRLDADRQPLPTAHSAVISGVTIRLAP